MSAKHTLFRIAAVVAIVAGSQFAVAQQARNVLLITFDGLRWQEFFGGLDERLLAPDTWSEKQAN